MYIYVNVLKKFEFKLKQFCCFLSSAFVMYPVVVAVTKGKAKRHSYTRAFKIKNCTNKNHDKRRNNEQSTPVKRTIRRKQFIIIKI